MEFLNKSNILNYQNRFQLCAEIINRDKLKTIAEIGVYRGEFAEYILKNCPSIEKYLMIDPWRNLDEWNKPANTDDNLFNQFYLETLSRTQFASEKIQVLKGKTTEVISEIEDKSLDMVYIDGDHTLKGITIDLITIWKKVKHEGFVVGDDFCPSIWQHDLTFEPTLVFPFTVYFAEAKNVRIYGMPFNQFLISKEKKGFEFVDLTDGAYRDKSLLHQLSNERGNGQKSFKKIRGLFK